MNIEKLQKIKDSGELPEGFVALKAPKRGKSRESLSDTKNTVRRVFNDRVASTDESLAFAWRVGCWLFDNKCYICLEDFAPGESVQADHVVPPKLGGSGNAGNMLPAHSHCNNDKGDIAPEVYFAESPETLEKIISLQKAFNFVSDPEFYTVAEEVADRMIKLFNKEVNRYSNFKALQLEDVDFVPAKSQETPDSLIVKNELRAVHYYLESNSYAESAKEKVKRHAARILNAWRATHSEDMFSQDAKVLTNFVVSYCLTLSDHFEIHQRTHRAFNVLAEVFDSDTLRAVYADNNPIAFSKLVENYTYGETGWVKKNAEILEV